MIYFKHLIHSEIFFHFAKKWHASISGMTRVIYRFEI